MAGIACLEEIFKLPHSFDVTILSEEPHVNYNRIMLSSVMAGEKKLDEIYLNPLSWYEKHQIDLKLGVKADKIDMKQKVVLGSDGSQTSFDKLLFATGSNPFIPPMEGLDKEGVYVFRNIADVQSILSKCGPDNRGVVIGGGLLGLEAARGISNQKTQTTVVHLMDRLMDMQLDLAGGEYLKRSIENLGVEVLLSKSTTGISGNGHVSGVYFKDGSEIPADFVVIACGIRPNVDLAKTTGVKINRGIEVNDLMETSHPDIFAVGECVEHRGKVYGLVAPLYDQAKILAKSITDQKEERYEGSILAAKLKIMGVDVFSAGSVKGEDPNEEVVKYEDPVSGIYKKCVVKEGKLVGAVLVGDAADANRLLEMIRSNEALDEKRKTLLFPSPEAAAGSKEDVMSFPETQTICGCLGVTKGEIVSSIISKGLVTMDELKEETKASTGCGTCSKTCQQILKVVSGVDYSKKEKDILCRCIPFEQDQLRVIIRSQELKSVQDVLDVYGDSHGCTKCKPALSYLVDQIWCGDHKEDRSSRFINDRVHGNIQRDGKFSVVPRMRGGVTTPQELRKIADVAEKYNAKMVKVTGSQRIDVLGVRKEDLPKIWGELDMPSGHAYAKAFRMVKSCVGSDFCRFGTQNSIRAGIELEKRLENLYTPAKVKMGVVGCPRNCAEVTVKDVGLVGFEGGWDVVIGGASGKSVRRADILVSVQEEEDALQVAMLFFQYYRENGKYLERTYDFVERLGVEKIRAETIYASEEEKKGLLDRLKKSKEKTFDLWKEEAKQPENPLQFKELNLVEPNDKSALIKKRRVKFGCAQ